MKARTKGGLRAWAWRVMDTMMSSLEGVLERYLEKRRPRGERRGGAGAPPPVRGDERTLRRIAEAQNGGISSEESVMRYARGENPGGMHHKAVHREEGPLYRRPAYEEPQGHKERIPGKARHMPENRKG